MYDAMPLGGHHAQAVAVAVSRKAGTFLRPAATSHPTGT